MPGNKEKDISKINTRINAGKAGVYTALELANEIRAGGDFNCAHIDVVTVACRAGISGTAAMLVVPVAGRGVFTRAKKIWLNGVPGFPGPAPNERLGVVDTMILAGQSSVHRGGNYTGAQLLVDIMRKKKIEVECLSMEGETYYNDFTIDQLQFARLYVYNLFFDQSDTNNESPSRDHHLKMIRAGSKILLNKAAGIVIGCGTRSTPARKALSVTADMFAMDPGLMTEFQGASGLSIANSLALAIPVTSPAVLNDLVEHLSMLNPVNSGTSTSTPEKDMALYLKGLILEQKFLLIDSDIELQNWVP